MINKDQRYRVTISFNISEASDKKAVRYMRRFVSEINEEEDNDCKLVSVQRYPFGKQLGNNLLDKN